MGGMDTPQPQNNDLFPKIFRFITEHANILVVILASLVVLAGIGIEGTRLYGNKEKKEAFEQKKLSLTKELQYWQGVARQYDNYRDVYFRIASLQYQLGDVDAAKQSLDKVLALDPNFENARVLGTQIEAK